MWKYYIGLFLVAGLVLLYIFFQDPCNQMLRADFSNRYPGYEIIDSGPREGSPESVQCHVYYQKPNSEEIHEEIWVYENSGSGWNFARILETPETGQTP